MELSQIIFKLETWTLETGDYHSDRQLADEILIADGWKVEPDAEFAGGIRWYWGTNPQISTSESTRPHPINDINAAIGIVPRDCNWMINCSKNRGDVIAMVRNNRKPYRYGIGTSVIERPSIALLIAALKYRSQES